MRGLNLTPLGRRIVNVFITLKRKTNKLCFSIFEISVRTYVYDSRNRNPTSLRFRRFPRWGIKKSRIFKSGVISAEAFESIVVETTVFLPVSLKFSISHCSTRRNAIDCVSWIVTTFWNSPRATITSQSPLPFYCGMPSRQNALCRTGLWLEKIVDIFDILCRFTAVTHS